MARQSRARGSAVSTRRFLSVCLCFLTALVLAGCQPKAAPAPAADDGFGGATRLDKAFRGEIVYLEPGAPTLPDFDKLKPAGVIWTRDFDIPTRSFREGYGRV